MPAATVKPGGGSARPALGQPRAAAGCGARRGRSCPARAKPRRPVARGSPAAGRATPASARASSGASAAASASARRLDLLDQQRIERPRQVRRHAAAPRPRVSPSPAPVRASASSRVSGSTAGGTGSSSIGRVERAADPLLELGVADRDQPRQHQPAAAGADERLGDACAPRGCWAAGSARGPAPADRGRSARSAPRPASRRTSDAPGS